METTIRKASPNDVREIVNIHQNAFKDFFLTSLGTDFLMFYYSSFITNSETVCLVAVQDNDEVVGFSAATMKSKGFNMRLIRSNIMAFFGWSCKMLFSNPKALVRLVKNLTKKSETVADNEEYAELFSIGVSTSCQGKGVGSLLLTETETLMGKHGVSSLSLTTDYNNNNSTIAFYQRNGYRVLYKFTAYPNREMYRFIKDLV